MLNLIKLELTKIKLVYLITLIIGLFFSGLMMIPYLTGYHYDNNLELWELSEEIFSAVYPLFAVIPTCWLLYYERKNNYLAYTQIRVSKRKYILSKYLVSSIGGGLMIFCISFFGLILCLYFLPRVDFSMVDLNRLMNITFEGEFYINHPFLYGLYVCFWRFVIGFLIASLGFILSAYIKNLFIILTFPFIYTIAENYILCILGKPLYRLIASFYFRAVSGRGITYHTLSIGPLILLSAITIAIIYFSIIKKEKIYEI